MDHRLLRQVMGRARRDDGELRIGLLDELRRARGLAPVMRHFQDIDLERAGERFF